MTKKDHFAAIGYVLLAGTLPTIIIVLSFTGGVVPQFYFLDASSDDRGLVALCAPILGPIIGYLLLNIFKPLRNQLTVTRFWLWTFLYALLVGALDIVIPEDPLISGIWFVSHLWIGAVLAVLAYVNYRKNHGSVIGVHGS